jgi:hypothetical protein
MWWQLGALNGSTVEKETLGLWCWLELTKANEGDVQVVSSSIL